MKTLKTVLFVISLIVIAYFLYHARESLNILSELNVYEIVALVIPTFLIIIFQARQFFDLIKTIRNDIAFIDILSIVSLSALYNNILPASGGTAIRGVLLKNKLSVPWSSLTAIFGAYYLASYIAMSAVLLITASIVYSLGQLPVMLYGSVIGFFLLLSGIIAILYNTNFQSSSGSALAKFINNTIQSVDELKKSRLTHYRTIVLQTIIVIVSAVKLYLCFQFLDIPVNFWKVFAVQSFIALSLVVSLTPGNIGIQEGVIVLFSGFLGISAENALICGLLFRATNLAAIILLGLAGKVHIIKQPA